MYLKTVLSEAISKLIVSSIELNKSCKSLPLVMLSLCSLSVYAGGSDSEIRSQLINKKDEISQNNASASFAKSATSTGSKKFIVKYREGYNSSRYLAADASSQVKHLKTLKNLAILEIPEDGNTQAVVDYYKNRPDIAYIEEDSRVHILTTANDPELIKLWGMRNTGQTAGTTDADINAVEAWDITTGSSNVVIGILDTGIDYNHPDLKNNIWKNTAEIANDGIDNDGNGYIDDVYGIDTANNDTDPMDGNNHGTHVAGTIGAHGNNGQGVVGVNWNVKMVACKFLNDQGNGSTSDAIECLDYLIDLKQNRGVNLVATNNSWGGGSRSQALEDAITAQQNAGILFIAAAGNDHNDIDTTPSYPASYSSSNVLSVASTDHKDELSYFSNYGAASVDVAAPGSNIYSTLPGGGYGYLSGTSMAAPHVTGLVALIAAYKPHLNSAQLKQLVMWSGTSLSSLSSKVLSGRRIRAWDNNGGGALTCSDQGNGAVTSPVNIASGAQHTLSLSNNETVLISYTSNGCTGAVTTVDITLDDAVVLTLRDDGQNGDINAGDGIASANYTFSGNSGQALTFPNASVLNLKPLLSYKPAEEVSWNWETISGVKLSIEDDQVKEITSPFAINFGGQDIGSKVFISANGVIQFENKNAGYLNKPLPYAALAPIAVSPFWDDLITPSRADDQGVFYQVVGEAPTRKLVIEWRKVRHYRVAREDKDITFQVVFNENSSDIAFNYKDVIFDSSVIDRGKSATIGIQQTRVKAQQFGFNRMALHNSMSLLWAINAPASEPVINAVEIQGTRKMGETLTFTVDASSADGAEIILYEIDFNGDGEFNYSGEDNSASFTYTDPGSFIYQIKVQTSAGKAISQLASITIDSVSVEERIRQAVVARETEIINDPNSVGLYSAGDRTQFARQSVLARDLEIISNPTVLNLISDVSVLDVERVNTLATGWHMVASPLLISDLSVFDDVVMITWFSHADDMFFGYSADNSVVQQMANAGIAIAASVPAGTGLWVKK